MRSIVEHAEREISNKGIFLNLNKVRKGASGLPPLLYTNDKFFYH
jgi:hypothetical protein